jgi:four helix bundle protein
MNSFSQNLQSRLFDFSIRIITVKSWLVNKKEFDLASQLFRSGTSVGANYEEACSAISKPEFIAKISISAKEASETVYWLQLLQKSELYDINVDNLLAEAIEIKKIFKSMVQTAQKGPKAPSSL